MYSRSITGKLFVHDVLEETNFEPWWEKLRGYCMKTILAVCTVMLYITNTIDPVRCGLKVPANVSLANHQALLINAYCYDQLSDVHKHFAIIATGYAVFIYLSMHWWLLCPCVIEGFRTLRSVDEMVARQDLSKSDIERLASSPRKDDDTGEIGHACAKIFGRHAPRPSIITIYTIRNSSCLLWISGGIAVLVSFGLLATDQKATDFNCSTSLLTHEVVDYTCMNILKKRLFPYEIIYFSMLIPMAAIMFLIQLYVLWKFHVSIFCCCRERRSDLQEDIAVLVRDNQFLRFFAQWSRPLHDATNTIINISDKEELQDMKEHGLRNAIKHFDRDYIKLFLRLQNESAAHLCRILEEEKPWASERFYTWAYNFRELFQAALHMRNFSLYAALHRGLFKSGNNRDYGSYSGCGCSVADVKFASEDRVQFCQSILQCSDDTDLKVLEHCLCIFMKLKEDFNIDSKSLFEHLSCRKPQQLNETWDEMIGILERENWLTTYDASRLRTNPDAWHTSWSAEQLSAQESCASSDAGIQGSSDAYSHDKANGGPEKPESLVLVHTLNMFQSCSSHQQGPEDTQALMSDD